MTDQPPLLKVRDLCVRYHAATDLFQRRPKMALDGVSLCLAESQSLGLVGESGCGKSLLARAVVGLVKPYSGSMLWRGRDILGRGGVRAVRREMRIVFQDPHASLNPRLRMARQLSEPLAAAGIGDARVRWDMVAAALDEVGMGTDALDRFAH